MPAGFEFIILAGIIFGIIILSNIISRLKSQPQKTLKKPCWVYGQRHDWKYVKMINSFGETIWFMYCKKCNRKSGDMD